MLLPHLELLFGAMLQALVVGSLNIRLAEESCVVRLGEGLLVRQVFVGQVVQDARWDGISGALGVLGRHRHVVLLSRRLGHRLLLVHWVFRSVRGLA